MLCVRRWSDAGPVGRVICWLVRCREPYTGQQKVQLYYEEDPLCPSNYIMYLCPPTLANAVCTTVHCITKVSGKEIISPPSLSLSIPSDCTEVIFNNVFNEIIDWFLCVLCMKIFGFINWYILAI